MAKKARPKGDGNGKAAAKAEAASPAQQQDENPEFGVLVQFVKDISFESPHSPEALRSPGDNPKLEVSVRVQATRHEDEVYEVDLVLEARAESDAGVIYNVEVVYGTLFQARNIPDQYMKQVLFVDAPTIMFPFLRRIVSDLTRDGGFQPLLLDPVDFAGLFQQNSDSAEIADAQQAS